MDESAGPGPRPGHARVGGWGEPQRGPEAAHVSGPGSTQAEQTPYYR